MQTLMSDNVGLLAGSKGHQHYSKKNKKTTTLYRQSLKIYFGVCCLLALHLLQTQYP